MVLSPEQIDLIKETVAKGVSDLQLQLFLHVCRKHRLDPLAKQIYCVLWPVRNNTAYDMVIIVGINGLRTTAARDHKDFAGTSKPVFQFSQDKTPAGRVIPTSVTMKAFRKDAEPSEVELFWEEFAPTDLRSSRADFWNRMPKHMLAKCAEAQALKKAYPDLSDVYIEEEVAQRMADLTPGGREITIDGVNPSGRIPPGSGNRIASQSSQDIAKSKADGCWCEKHKCDTKFCPSEEHTAQENEEAFEREERRKRSPDSTTPTTPASPAATTPKTAGAPPASTASPNPVGKVIVDCTDDPNNPMVRGDLDAWSDGLQKHCEAFRRDGWWRIPRKHIATLRTMCQQVNYEIEVIDPPQTQKKAKPKAQQRATPGEHVVSGIIEKALTKGGRSPRIDFLVKTDLGSFWMGCFSKTWFTLLAKEPLPKPATLVIKTTVKDEKTTYRNILRATKIGSKEYDEDGKEILQVNREPGNPSLFRE